MAIITSTIAVSNSSFFSEGKTYTYTVLHLVGLTSIVTIVNNITAATIDISYEEDLLPEGVSELSECNLEDPVLQIETCCDVTYYDVADASALADLVAIGVQAFAPLGRNLIRVGPNPQYPNEIWEYSKSGDPQTLSNWYRVEILSTTWGTQVVASDSTLTGLGTVGDPLGLAVVPLSEKPLYILGMGQSNLLGRGTGGGDLETSELVKVWNVTNQDWETWDLTANPAQATGATVGANCFTFHAAKRLSLKLNRKVRVIIAAAGGRPISDWVPTSGSEWQRMLTQTANAGIAEYDAVFWHQGENDHARTNADYKTDFEAFIAQVRAYAPTSNAPLLAGQLLNNGTTDNQNGVYSIEAMAEFQDENVWLVPAKNLQHDSLTTASAHFSGWSLRELGRRYFLQLELAQHGISIFETSPGANVVSCSTGVGYVSYPQTATIGIGQHLSFAADLTITDFGQLNILLAGDNGATATPRVVLYTQPTTGRLDIITPYGAIEVNTGTGVFLKAGERITLAMTLECNASQTISTVYVNGMPCAIDARAALDAPRSLTALKLGAYRNGAGIAKAKYHRGAYAPRLFSPDEVARWHRGESIKISTNGSDLINAGIDAATWYSAQGGSDATVSGANAIINRF